MLNFTNRNGETVSTNLTREELAARFAEVAHDDSWLWFWITKEVNRAPSRAALTNAIAFLGDSFLYSIGMGLKRPMIRAQFVNRRFKIYLSARGSLCFKSGAVHPDTRKPTGDEVYFGCLYRGDFLPAQGRTLLEIEQEFIDKLKTNPVDFLATCSRDMDRCCYCDKPLSDPRAKEVGYGRQCASNWGLPWSKKDYDEKIPSFAELWDRAPTGEKKTVHSMMVAIRDDVHNEGLWKILGDALQEAGWSAERLPTVPESEVRIPAL